MVGTRYLLGPFHQLPLHIVSGALIIDIPLVCEKHVLYIVQLMEVKGSPFGDWHPLL